MKRKAKLALVGQECATVRAFDPLVRQIDQAVAPTGEVKDDASPELNRVRIRLRRMRREIMRSMDTIVQSNPDLFQDQSVSIRAGRFVLPLRADAKGRFDAVLHDTSDSGHTLIVEPLSVLAEQNEIHPAAQCRAGGSPARAAPHHRGAHAEAEQLTAALQGVSRLDLLLAKKRFAVKFDAVRRGDTIRNRPHQNGSSVQLINARHPLLQIKKGGVVPLNFVLPDDCGVVVVSGPNAGGKTVAMKTLGLFALLLSAGLFLPAAEGTELPLFEKVMADIGDEQSLEGDLSSFSAHLMRTRQILERADKSSLILLDEIGGSTSPEEGSALAVAVLERLKEQGAVTVATSHLGPLKAFVQDTKGMANAAME